jgi:DNA repair exonuclease SbcCD nuclease subunit
MFFDPLKEMGAIVYMLAGNHDTYFKNTNDVNSVDLLLAEYDNIHVISEPKGINIGNKSIAMLPWICADNYEESMNFIKDSKDDVCMGHFEIAGFAMHRGMPSTEGIDRTTFRKFSHTFSGHYHHKSNADDIYYLGNPYQLTWQDYGDERGFHLFNIYSLDLEFIANPNVMFHRIVYDDKAETIKEITDKKFDKYTNTYVKVVVLNKTNPYLFDKFMNNLYNANPADITIAEDFTDLTEGLDDDVVDQTEDTLTILNKFVDSVQEEKIDNNKLKKLLKELYVESQNQET